MQTLANLAGIDASLISRFVTINPRVASDDYATSGNTDNTSNRYYRFLGTEPLFPWGSMVPCILPCVLENNQIIKFTIPGSRIRHFMTDISITFLSRKQYYYIGLEKLILKLGSNVILQEFDSNFAVDIAYLYKSSIDPRIVKTQEYGNDESGIYRYTVRLPLYFNESLLRALPLFVPSLPSPEIEIYLEKPLDDSVVVEDSVKMLCEFVHSPLEIDGGSGTGTITVPVTQHISNYKTILSEDYDIKDLRQSDKQLTINIPIHVKELENKVIRSVYFRILNADRQTQNDLKCVSSVDIFIPSPSKSVKEAKSIFGGPIPGSLCGGIFKQKYGVTHFESYYVLPLSISPKGSTADYGVTFSEDSNMLINIDLLTSEINELDVDTIKVEICLEYFVKINWRAG